MIKEDVRIIQKTNWRKTIVFFILIGLLILSLFYHKEEHDNYTESFKGETIGLATRFKHGRKVKYVQYYFYLDKKIISKISIDNNTDSTVLEKFYKIKYDLNKPEENYIVLEEELKPDSITLVKAGFAKTKYYIYDDGVTCKYIEKSKWK